MIKPNRPLTFVERLEACRDTFREMTHVRRLPEDEAQIEATLKFLTREIGKLRMRELAGRGEA
jgi:hypothetical protein